MAAEHVLQELRIKQQERGLSWRAVARELGVSHVLLLGIFQGRRTLTRDVQKAIERFLKPQPSVTLNATLGSFLKCSAHRSPKTVETLCERLTPFIADHVEGFLAVISKGRRGRPLSPASVFGFTKDVRAFVNYIADTLAPDD